MLVNFSIPFIVIVPSLCKGILEETDLDVLVKELDSISTKWFELGESIGMYITKLDRIHEQHSPDYRVCLRMALSDWFKNTISSKLNWSNIVEGVRASGDFQLAYELKRKYCSSELSLT